MNKKRRTQLRTAAEYLARASDIISDVEEEEQDSLDNMPENLSSCDMCAAMEEAVDLLEDALNHINEADEIIDRVIGG